MNLMLPHSGVCVLGVGGEGLNLSGALVLPLECQQSENSNFTANIDQQQVTAPLEQVGSRARIGSPWVLLT